MPSRYKEKNVGPSAKNVLQGRDVLFMKIFESLTSFNGNKTSTHIQGGITKDIRHVSDR